MHHNAHDTRNNAMTHLLRVLTIHSGRDLLKYKSFFALIFGLIALDRIVHRWLPAGRPGFDPGFLSGYGPKTAAYVFENLPGQVLDGLTDYRALIVVAGLFGLKQIISLWPSSDMRRMHRLERERFGLWAALAAIRWEQVVWDLVAVATICGVLGIWSLAAFILTRTGWHVHHNPAWLLSFAGLVFLAAPIAMAGFSFSSKLAVLSRGRFGEKLGYFYLLFTDWRVFWSSWVFFLVRILIETLFVLTIPALAILFMGNFWLRMMVAALSATPVYAYLKMASFKFFLFTYGRFPLVREEYRLYFQPAARE
jgi:hypothetical protein